MAKNYSIYLEVIFHQAPRGGMCYEHTVLGLHEVMEESRKS